MKRQYFTPLIPALQPYPISQCMTSPSCLGGFIVAREGLESIVAVEPMSNNGSGFRLEMWKFGLKIDRNLLMLLAICLWPRHRWSSSMVKVRSTGADDCGRSTVRTGGGLGLRGTEGVVLVGCRCCSLVGGDDWVCECCTVSWLGDSAGESVLPKPLFWRWVLLRNARVLKPGEAKRSKMI